LKKTGSYAIYVDATYITCARLLVNGEQNQTGYYWICLFCHSGILDGSQVLFINPSQQLTSPLDKNRAVLDCLLLSMGVPEAMEGARDPPAAGKRRRGTAAVIFIAVLPLLLLLFFFSNRAADSQLLWSQVKQQSMTPTFPEA
jgi:hypothetical protein